MKTRRIMGSFALMLLLCLSSLFAQETRPETEEARLRFAATQHEIISILIEENQFSVIPSEFAKILNLNLNDGKLIVQEAWIVTESLVEAQQFELAHEVVDMTLNVANEEENRFTLLMLKGKVYKQQGQFGDAIAVFRKAQALRN